MLALLLMRTGAGVRRNGFPEDQEEQAVLLCGGRVVGLLAE